MNILKKNKKYLEINITPLIDIVFLLLVFFMIVINYDEYKSFKINTSSNIKEATSVVNKDVTVTINISNNGTIKINKEAINIGQLSKKLLKIKRKNNIDEIVIKTSNKTKVKYLVKVMDELYAMNHTNITIINN